MEIAASWLSGDLLLATGPVRVEDDDRLEVFHASGKRNVLLETAWLSCDDDVNRDSLTLFLIRFDQAPDESHPAPLLIRSGSDPVRFDLTGSRTDLQSLCRERLAILDAETRARILDFLSSSLRWDHLPAERLQLSRNLLVVRDALRERLPYCSATFEGETQLHVDAIVASDDRSFLITGWMVEPNAAVVSLTAVAPEGMRAELPARLCRHPHRQVPHQAGFTSSFVLERPSVLEEGWRLELRLASGLGLEVKAPRTVNSLASARRLLFDCLSREEVGQDTLMREHLFPALDRLQSCMRARVQIERVVQYGNPRGAADVSLLVPLGERVDLLEHHLAQFVSDPEMTAADLVYIHDSTVSRERFEERAAQLFDLYRVPFRLATLAEYSGFAAAVDVGTLLAHGELILILSPQTLPARPGWLSRLVSVHRATAGIGAIVPTLLAADGSVHEDPVAGVSAACLLLDRAMLGGLNGLCGRYVQDDFEAADLCLRLNGAGRQNWRVSPVELYALREDSRFGSLRKVESRYDQWVHAYLWNEQRPTLLVSEGVTR